MARDLTGSVVSQLEVDQNSPFHLYEITVAAPTTYIETTYYLTDYSRDIDWNSNTYVGPLPISFTDVEETLELMVTETTVTLSAVDQVLISLFLNYLYMDRPIIIRRALMGSDDSIIVDPFIVFEGRMDNVAIRENPDPDSGFSEIAVRATSHFADWARHSGRHTNHAEQQFWFPGDMGLEYASQIVQELRWGVGTGG